MRLNQIEIKNFRRIKYLKWTLKTRISCLIGPGDSTKSTILDAIDFVMSSRWSIPFADTDFFECDTSVPITIEAVVGDLPQSLLEEESLGLNLRGWSPEFELHDEPLDGDESVVSIRLQVDSSLEPVWELVSERSPQGTPVSSRQRERLAVMRLGQGADRHLTWSRQSALMRATAKEDLVGVGGLLAQANRRAREAASSGDATMDALQKVATSVEAQAKQLGVTPQSSYKPALDWYHHHSSDMGPLSLHDGLVPLRLSGLGSRRLATLAAQLAATTLDGAMLLVDEVEAGLEPYRVRGLARMLCNSTSPRHGSSNQVIVTTHSPAALQTVGAKNLVVVRSTSGTTTTKQVNEEELRDVVAYCPEALLSRRVVVCEGITELGFCQKLIEHWDALNLTDPHACLGISLVVGTGASAPRRASELRNLGYDVLHFGDSDTKLVPSKAHLESAGVKVIAWEGETCIEQRLCQDLPITGLHEISILATSCGHDPAKIRADLRATIGKGVVDAEQCEVSSLIVILGEEKTRQVLGESASRGKWFKSEAGGTALAGLAINHLEAMAVPTRAGLEQLQQWIYAV